MAGNGSLPALLLIRLHKNTKKEGNRPLFLLHDEISFDITRMASY